MADHGGTGRDELAASVAGAKAYEELHVPALFREWAVPVLAAAGVTDGDRVLDVACGTGIVARAARGRVGAAGSVVGLDIDPGMLAVAADIDPDVTWVEGSAGDLPFDDDEFAAVVSQFGLMFFPDRVGAVREMLRCVRSGGAVAVVVWDALERSEAYPITVALLDRAAGAAAAAALRAPFALGDTGELRALFDAAGASSVTIETRHGTARFPSVRSMVEADLRGWLPVMGVHLDEALIAEILDLAEDELRSFVADDGAMVFDAPAHIAVARR